MSEENETIIRALNKYGRVPETYELLNEIDRLNNIINEILKYIENNKTNTYQTLNFENGESYNTALLELLDILRGDKE